VRYLISTANTNLDGKIFFNFQLNLKKLTAESKISLSAHVHRDGSMHLALTDKTSSEVDQITLHSE
jgi:hypothetical protein